MPSRRVAGPAAATVFALVLAGCGAGGFGGDTPERAPQAPVRHYVALGDGFAAAPYVGKTVRARGCLRSRNNYPARVASRLGIKVADHSCTSATTGSILQGSEAPAGKGRLPAQIDAVKPDTDLVTITIGVNDNELLFRSFLVCMKDPCGQRIAPQLLANEVETVGNTATDIVRAVAEKAPGALIVLVGYPQIAPKTQSCATLPTLDDLQVTGVRALFFQLNRQLQDAARQTGAAFADLSEVTDSHELCSSDPWLRNADPEQGPRAALHPLGPEQKAAADAVMAAVALR